MVRSNLILNQGRSGQVASVLDHPDQCSRLSSKIHQVWAVKCRHAQSRKAMDKFFKAVSPTLHPKKKEQAHERRQFYGKRDQTCPGSDVSATSGGWAVVIFLEWNSYHHWERGSSLATRMQSSINCIPIFYEIVGRNPGLIPFLYPSPESPGDMFHNENRSLSNKTYRGTTTQSQSGSAKKEVMLLQVFKGWTCVVWPISPKSKRLWQDTAVPCPMMTTAPQDLKPQTWLQDPQKPQKRKTRPGIRRHSKRSSVFPPTCRTGCQKSGWAPELPSL